MSASDTIRSARSLDRSIARSLATCSFCFFDAHCGGDGARDRRTCRDTLDYKRSAVAISSSLNIQMCNNQASKRTRRRAPAAFCRVQCAPTLIKTKRAALNRRLKNVASRRLNLRHFFRYLHRGRRRQRLQKCCFNECKQKWRV